MSTTTARRGILAHPGSRATVGELAREVLLILEELGETDPEDRTGPVGREMERHAFRVLLRSLEAMGARLHVDNNVAPVAHLGPEALRVKVEHNPFATVRKS